MTDGWMPRTLVGRPRTCSGRTLANECVLAWRTPGPILADHAEDKFAQFPVHALPAGAISMQRNPGPIRFEPGSAPSHNGLRLDNNQRLFPSTPEPSQQHPEQSFRGNKPRLRMLPL